MELTHEQKIKFLEMVRDLKSPIFFKQELELSLGQVEKLKKEFGAETQEDARRLLKKLRMKETAFDMNRAIIEEKARQDQANARLKEEKTKEKKVAKKPNPIKVKKEDVKRQKRFEKSKVKVVKTNWKLPEDQPVERFQHDLQNRGMQFCIDKYGVESDDIKAEAARLKIKIDWERVSR